MLTGFKSILLLITTSLLSFTYTNGQNLLTNGNFESGGSGNGFLVHNYALINPVNGTSTPGKYAWTTNPSLMNSTYISGGDHTTGSGKMLVIDGATSSNQFFWTASSTGGTLAGFTIGTTYTFSFYVKSVSNDVTNNATQTTINAFFVNASNYNPSSLSTQVPLPASGWQKVSFSFTANATNVLIRLFTSSTSTIGNDFAVDDFEIKAGALPFILVSNSSTNPSCPSINDGTITATASGGSTPYKYALTGTSVANNSTGKFTNLLEGPYTVTITDFSGASLPPITGIVLSAPNPLLVSATLPTVCPGSPTTLNVSGATTGYTWTASPTDPSLTTPNSASITVSPTQTTTYTASTGKTTSTTNLINNGDFEFGDVDFTSDYVTNVNPNPGGIRKAYAIVTNPKSWFTAFSTCVDNTSGIGNMMVADGSELNGGNDKFWVQNGVSVVPGTDYDFTYYLQSVTTGAPARIEIYINGVSLGAPVAASSTPCNWEKHTYKWNSMSNSFASIVIYDRETSGGGNDFALDDISLVESPVCPLSKSITITVNSTLTLNIIDPAPICSGGTVDITVPAVTLGSTTGTTLTYWTDPAATIALPNPTSITTSGTYYIKSTLGSCSIIKPVLVSINSSGGVPTPGVNPVSYCQNGVAPALTATPATTATLNWYGINATGGTASSTAPITSTASLGTIKYYVSQSIGTCESPRVAIDVTINTNVTPTFAAPSPICSGDTLFTLPPSSNNSIAGTWLPAFDNTKTDTYTFTPTPTPGLCATTAPLIVTVNTKVTPTFAAPSPICSGDTLFTLPPSSNNSITGTWLPAFDNTKTDTYTFTPDANQCATTAPLIVTVNTKVTPTFVTPSPICTGDTLFTLPLSSSNSIAGTWSPVFDNTKTDTYTFTPTTGLCATTALLIVTVNTKVKPTFAATPAICSGDTLFTLPLSSSNIITGTWSPVFDNTKTDTYTFKPDANQCATTAPLTVTVNQKTTPLFATAPAICSGDALFTLPPSSSNSIAGTWSPVFDNTKTDTYTFTPTTGLCATTAPLIVTVNPNVTPTFTAVPDICIGATLLPLPLSSLETITGNWSPPIDNTTTTLYTFTPTAGLCATDTTLTITINSSATIIPLFDTVDPICVGGVLSDLPLTSLNAIKGSWTPPLNTTVTTTYIFTPNLGQCAATAPLQIEVLDIPIVQANAVSSSICSGSTTAITLTSNAPATTLNWNTINSNATGATAGSGDKINQKLSTVGNQSGEVVYAITPSANGCNGLTILVPIIVNPIPQVSASTNLQTICSGGSTNILLSSEVGLTTFDWTVIQTGVLGGLSGNDSTIVQTLTTTDIKEGFAEYVVTPKFNGCSGTPLSVEVRVNPIPAIFGTGGSDICSGNYTNIKLIPNPNIPLTTFEWTANPIDVTGAKDDSGEDVIEQLLETVTGGSVTYTVTPSYGGCKGIPSLVKINVDPIPKPNLKDGKICIEKATGNTLNPYLIETNLNNPNFEFEWYFKSVKIPGATQNSYEASEIGEYSVLVFNKLTGCTSKETFATMTEMFPANSYTIEQTGAFTENASITITVDGDLNEYLYKLDDGVWQNANVFSGISSGLHTISITDIEGCTSFTDTVTIIDYPKFFTPNGDGFNDTWNVVGLGENENAKLSIYDRFGKLVKQISSDGTGWDGTFNNQLLPATDYWFTINYFENKIEKLFKAHFSLKR